MESGEFYPRIARMAQMNGTQRTQILRKLRKFGVGNADQEAGKAKLFQKSTISLKTKSSNLGSSQPKKSNQSAQHTDFIF